METGIKSKATITSALKLAAARGFFQRTEKRSLWLVRELDEPQLYGRHPRRQRPFPHTKSKPTTPGTDTFLA